MDTSPKGELLDLVAEDAAKVSTAYVLTGDGLKKLP